MTVRATSTPQQVAPERLPDRELVKLPENNSCCLKTTNNPTRSRVVDNLVIPVYNQYIDSKKRGAKISVYIGD